MTEYQPIHQQVWDKINDLEEQLFQKNKQLSSAHRKLNAQRRIMGKQRKEIEQLRKQIEPKQYYRNGKRNRNHGFNG